MGKTLTGGVTRKEDINLLNPQQQQLFSQALQQIGPGALESLQAATQPMSQEDLQATFQQSYVDPALQALQQQILPAIQQRFVDVGAGSSSALNQALARAASDVSTQLGSQFGQYSVGQQQLQQNALSQFLPLLGKQTTQPQFQQTQGILGPLIGTSGQLGAAYLIGR